MSIPITVVDAFTTQRFSGNPAAVCFPDAGKDAAWMQAIAAEMNLSETAFLEPRPDGFGLRWFTPAVEVDLCGHATLASAHVLWESGRLSADTPARFHTRSGELICRCRDGAIEMDFPAVPVREVEPGPALLAALSLQPEQVRACGITPNWHFLHLANEALVRGLAPDFHALKALPVGRALVTAAAERGRDYDFVSRFFAPNAGINEDPVTGSAHCTLAPYWARLLGKAEMTGYQASARGGYMSVRPLGDRVYLTGQAITVLRGELA